jgi:hypothetical protein
MITYYYSYKFCPKTRHIVRGTSLKEVREILGHKTMTMTLRYSHLSQEHKNIAVNLLNGLAALPTKHDDSGHKMVTFLDESISPISVSFSVSVCNLNLNHVECVLTIDIYWQIINRERIKTRRYPCLLR